MFTLPDMKDANWNPSQYMPLTVQGLDLTVPRESDRVWGWGGYKIAPFAHKGGGGYMW